MAAIHGDDGQLLVKTFTIDELGAADERVAQEIQKKQADQEKQLENKRKL